MGQSRALVGNGVSRSSPVRATQYIRRMRGGAQSHLMRCCDGEFYVVKFQNNPQGKRVLANELLGMRLACLLGLPVAHGNVIIVDDWLIRISEELVFEQVHGSIRCQAGLCFGSRLPIDPRDYPVCDMVPRTILPGVENLDDFKGMLVFDLWTGNTDARQVIFYPHLNRLYRAVMIDQGHCFSGREWAFPESPLRALYWHNKGVYENVEGVEPFEPWLNKLECGISETMLRDAGQEIPPEWYESDFESLKQLLRNLERRRTQVRALLWSLRNSIHSPFPKWLSAVAVG